MVLRKSIATYRITGLLMMSVFIIMLEQEMKAQPSERALKKPIYRKKRNDRRSRKLALEFSVLQPWLQTRQVANKTGSTEVLSLMWIKKLT